MVADDPRIEGVVVTCDHLQAGPARTGDLRAFVDSLRQAGKRVVFHSHTVQGREYEIALSADEILMTPGGRLYLFGYRFEQYFASSLLDKLGVTAQFVHIGPFKGSAHRFIHSEAPAPLRLMLEEVVQGLSTIGEERICQARGIEPSSLEESFAAMPIDDHLALYKGWIDGRVQRPDLKRWLQESDAFLDSPHLAKGPGTQERGRHDAAKKAKESDSTAEVDLRDAEAYAASHPGRVPWSPLFRRPKVIATVDLSGMIVMPDMELPGQSLATIDPSEILPVLTRLQQDRRVAAVVLHINSPGGSALASELIWDGIRRLRYEKPTIAYCSDIAASGGYYIAVAADCIVCQPDTITGSIGVISGKFSLPGALEKLEIGSEAFYRHESSRFQSVAEPLSEEVLANLQRDARAFYRQFLRRVGEARQIPHRRLHRYARGRIYTGESAHQRFLVDHLGGFERAVELARSAVEPNLSADTEVVFHSHRATNLAALVRKSAVTTSMLDELVAEPALLHAMVRRDPLLALMPYRADP